MTILLSTFFATGCWDYRELDKDSVIDSLAYDITENGNAAVAAEIPNFRSTSNSKGGENKQSKMEIITASGHTFYEAIQNLTDVLPGTLTFSHHRVNIFSENMAKSEFFPNVLDRLIRVGEIRRRTLFFITSDRAEDIFEHKIHVSGNIGEGLTGLAQASTEQQYGMKVDLNDFLYEMSTPGIDPMIPRLVIQHTSLDTDEISVFGSGVIRKERFAGWLSGNETRAALWVKGQSGHPTFSINWNGEKMIVKTKEIHGKIITLPSKDTPQFIVKIKWAGDMSMYSGNKEIRFQDTPAIENEISKSLRSTVDESIKRAQSMQTDVFGFGNALYCKNPSLYKNRFMNDWDTTGFPYAKINVSVESTLLGLGYSLTPPEKR